MSASKTYQVLSPVVAKGKTYPVGSEVAMPEEHAQSLIRLGCLADTNAEAEAQAKAEEEAKAKAEAEAAKAKPAAKGKGA